MSGSRERIAIVGAGMAGLTCATALELAGPEVIVFEAAYHPGGRMACLRQDGYEFDSGLPYFSAADERFRFTLEHWLEEGVIAPWEGWFVDLEHGNFLRREQAAPWYVGVPNMGSLARHLSGLCRVECGVRVAGIRREDGRWRLSDAAGRDLGHFDQVLLAVPAAVAGRLLEAVVPEWHERLSALEATRTWVLMLGFAERQALFFDAAYVSDSPINWMARNNSKPGRAERESWVVEATPEWTRHFAHLAPEEVAVRLFRAMQEASGVHLDAPQLRVLRAWQPGRAIDVLGEPWLYDSDAGLGLCGDWCLGTTVEAAFLSGLGLGEAVSEAVLS
ncbi:MAG: FAD-binding protein [Gammaproteobacteria bacterium]|nr:MAG: FAD-binding protein [Gammaproteobacteria bacterium]